MRLGVEAALVRGRLLMGDVEVEDGVVTDAGLPGRGRGIAAPGFVDLQVNGFAGVDFLGADRDGYRTAGEALLATGVTAYLPTFITSAPEATVAALRELPVDLGGPRILGAHLEGPFISPRRLGTHPREHRRDPDQGLLDRLLEAGPVRLVTLAPELPGALALVDRMLARGIAVSLGHSDATAAEANAAFDRGVRAVTHVFNAMRPLTHRDPGIVGAALLRPDVVIQAIVDGIHLDDDIVRLLWTVAHGRMSLVTDAVAAAGLGDGAYRLGDVDLDVRDGVVRSGDGILAGSALTMVEAVRNLVGAGAPLEEALAAASSVPASVLRLEGCGRLEPGLPADVVVLDDALEINRVLVGGDTLVAA